MQHNPLITLNAHKQQQFHLSQRLASAIRQALDKQTQRLALAGQTLQTVSPLATLNRGYALATVASSNEIIRSFQQVKPNDLIMIRLSEGKLYSQVTAIMDNGESGKPDSGTPATSSKIPAQTK